VGRFLIKIEYEGTSYCGWQEQDIRKAKQKSIQQVIESALFDLWGKKIKVFSAGRTDAGVHSLCQSAHFDIDTKLTSEKILKAINARLPLDVAIVECTNVPTTFHSRFSPSIKTYLYTILNRGIRPVLDRRYCHFVPYRLNIRRMQKEIGFIIGRHDFKSFQAKDKKERTSIRTITCARVWKTNNKIHIQISADGFLYNMVRNIVGTLIDIGRGKIESGGMKRILESRDRAFAGPTVPAKGLCLVKIDYLI
jgi:tRNA pseudouridine38-40 synthase